MSLDELSSLVGRLLQKQKLTLSTAESCTGGGIAACITSIPGSSAYFQGGVVAYSNEVKCNMLHVSPQTLEKYGAVSQEVVTEMVKGAMHALNSDCAIATSGVAGPGGGSEKNPVGTIWMAVAHKEKIITWKQEGDAGRNENVKEAIKNALFLLYNMIK